MSQRMLLCSLFLAAASPALGQQTYTWDGFNDPLVTVGSYFDPEGWENFAVPNNLGVDDVILFPGDNPVPTVLYFGDYQPVSGPPTTFGGFGGSTNAETVIEGGEYIFDFDPFNVPDGNSGSYQTSALVLDGELAVRGSGTLFAIVGPESGGGKLTVTGPNVVWQTFISEFTGGTALEVNSGAKTVAEILAFQDGSQAVFTGAGTRLSPLVSPNHTSLIVGGSFTGTGGNSSATFMDGAVVEKADVIVDYGGDVSFQGPNTSGQTTGVRVGLFQDPAGVANAPVFRVSQGASVSTVADGNEIEVARVGTYGGIDPPTLGQLAHTSSAEVAGSGSQWTVEGILVVGDNLHGSLVVRDGGYLQSSNATIARTSGIDGTALVTRTSGSGPGGTWDIDEYLTIGGEVTGFSNIDGGSGSLEVGIASTVSVGTEVKIFEDSSLITSGGKVRIGNPLSATPDDTVHIGPGGTLAGVSQVDSPHVWNEDGTVSVGLSPGELLFTGDYTQGPNSLLDLEIAAADVFDVLHVAGDVDLQGLIRVTFADGYQPALNTSFELITAGGTLSDNSTVEIYGAPGYEFDATTLGKSYQVTVVQTPEPTAIALSLVGGLLMLLLLSRCKAHRRDRQFARVPLQ